MPVAILVCTDLLLPGYTEAREAENSRSLLLTDQQNVCRLRHQALKCGIDLQALWESISGQDPWAA